MECGLWIGGGDASQCERNEGGREFAKDGYINITKYIALPDGSYCLLGCLRVV